MCVYIYICKWVLSFDLFQSIGPFDHFDIDGFQFRTMTPGSSQQRVAPPMVGLDLEGAVVSNAFDMAN